MSQCEVCFNLLDGSEPCGRIFCGHVFHIECVKVVGNMCPTCNIKIRKVCDILPLYISAFKNDFMNSQVIVKNSETANAKIEDKNAELSNVKSEIKKRLLYAKDCENKRSEVEQIKYHKEFQVQELERQLKSTEIEKKKVSTILASNKFILENIDRMSHEQTMLSSAQSILEQMLLNVQSPDDHSPITSRRCAQYCAILKFILTESMEKAQKLKEVLRKRKLQRLRVAEKSNFLKLEFGKLKNELTAVEKDLKKKAHIHVKQSTNSNGTATMDYSPNSNQASSFSDCLSFYLNDKKAPIFCYLKNTGVIRNFVSDFLITYSDCIDTNNMNIKCLEDAQTEYDSNWISNIFKLSKAVSINTKSLNHSVNLQKPLTVRYSVIQEYNITLPLDQSNLVLPNEAPNDNNDMKWLSEGYQIVSNSSAFVYHYFPEMLIKNDSFQKDEESSFLFPGKFFKQKNISMALKRKRDLSDSVLRSGYDGLGGHSTIFVKSSNVFKKSPKGAIRKKK